MSYKDPWESLEAMGGSFRDGFSGLKVVIGAFPTLELYWSGQIWRESPVIGYGCLAHIIRHLRLHPRFLSGVIQYCSSQ